MRISKNLIALPALALLLAGCTPTTPPTDTQTDTSSSAAMMDDSSQGMMDASSAATSEDDAMQTSSAASVMATDKHVVSMEASNWAFTPNSVTFKKGEKAYISLKGVNGVHSFMSADLGLNVKVSPGETVVIEIPTDKAGTFSFRCGVPCGEGHRDMVGTVVIS